MLEDLEQLAIDIAARKSKLILLVSPLHIGTTALLLAFAKHVGARILNVGSEVGRRLAVVPEKQRPLQAIAALRELADEYSKDDLLLIDNIELLFDPTLQLNPLDLLKRQAGNRRVIAIWPGELHDGRLTYADMGHPEHQDYSVDGLVTFQTQS